MTSTDLKDKIVIDPADDPAVAELFSNKQPGDKVSGHFEATVDEAGEKVITLSIKKIDFMKDEESDETGEDEAAEEAAEGASGGAAGESGEPSESAAVSIYKDKNGNPAQGDDEAK